MPVLILGVAVIVLIISIVSIFGKKPAEKSSAEISISGNESASDSGAVEESTAVNTTTVAIDMDSCAIPIGTTLKVTASINSPNTEKALNWSSSDQEVFTVDQDGIVTVKGKGMAALTATLGNVSSAIVIEGIENADTAKSQYDLPIYNLTTGGANGTSSNTTTGGNAAGNTNTSGGTSDSGNAGNTNTSGGTSNPGNAGSTNTSGGTSNPGTGTNTGGTSNPGTGTNTGSTSTGATSTEVASSLSGIGYSQSVSNVYIYEENGTYYGEIVIEPNVTIIYIKQRSDAYDAKIQAVIAKLLPKESQQAWNNYVSASSDRTFTLEGRMVRIVTALNGGHSQIVIYN